MTDRQVAIDALVRELARPGGLVDHLDGLLLAQQTRQRTDTRQRKISGSPAPWAADVAGVVFEIHAGCRELETQLRAHLGYSDRPRGGSTRNTKACIEWLPRLAAVAGEEHQRELERRLGSWTRAARQLPDLDTEQRWTRAPTEPGKTPPSCGVCECHSLRINRDLGVAACFNPACKTEDGRRHEWDLVTLGLAEGAAA